MSAKIKNIPDAHIIPDGDLNGIIVRLFSMGRTLELVHDAMENDADERPRNAVYSLTFLTRQIANDLDALQNKSAAVNSVDATVALAALMDKRTKGNAKEEASA